MNAAILSGGVSGSFGSALGYALKDHDGIGTERFGQVETVNLFSKPEQAHLEMQATADAAKEIQAQAREERGERSGASGSRAKKDCLHYALSWHAEDKPTPEFMFETARKSLDVLGLGQHQAVIVQHVERKTPHLHVTVGLTHPETGRTANLYGNAFKLDRFCHQIEKGQEMFRSFSRAAKYERELERIRKSPEKQKEAWNTKQRELSAAREKTRLRSRPSTLSGRRHTQSRSTRSGGTPISRNRPRKRSTGIRSMTIGGGRHQK
ncbi:relaxase/mobilization nuclease domain-containing protein [Lichenifustis flavocetrariae]|uniref:Relaxase/mobilization nuclease domain-containing protein n=1 Tax=Lichenifustis flavocetrariae TaxID=2949735 RepID=A0AA42CS13_9HYPH|nr:relaxase/mobilization nuclease domain-containing protein [Lichenifustis flavocetrariae]MCW6513025.1 relaxase/mobilization nuclease domain-containing protein [Lichenifustis flavocetrariae]